ncbi:MAG: TIGR02391 family protein, partial [Nitrososphaera sp.]
MRGMHHLYRRTMNLQTHIRSSLWLAIQSTYQANNYSHAILDAMHYLSNVLRDKTGVDGDGAALVGQALGGDSPRLRINKLQTETEKNEQRGIESILRGMYQAIRNPRSHEQIEDTQQTADAVIYFIDYLLVIVEKSEEPFTMSKFIARVFDSDFVKSDHYVELLVGEIPTNKRLDTLITIYREKLKGDIYSIGLLVRSLIGKISDDQVKQYLAIVSEELSTVTDEANIRYNLHLLPPNLWGELSEISRLRIENRVIREIKEGKLDNGICKKGALATWARNHFK